MAVPQVPACAWRAQPPLLSNARFADTSLMIVVGLDLSLTSTGVATSKWTRRLQPKKSTSYPRLRWLRTQIIDICADVLPDLVVVEGPSYGSVGKGQHERGGLWWMITDVIDDAGIPLAVVPPANLKKYATGVGAGPKAGKEFVTAAAARRFYWFQGNNDEADALWLAAMGHDHLDDAIVHVPALHRNALAGCQWPISVPDSVVDSAKR